MGEAMTNCYQCGLLSKPYAIWHWQSGKPAKSYCFLCWDKQMRALKDPKLRKAIEASSEIQRGPLCRFTKWATQWMR